MASRVALIVGVVVVALIIVVATYMLAQKPAPPTETSPSPSPSPSPTSPPAAKVSIRWGTSRAGSSGYRALSTLASLVAQEMPEIEITPVPTAGAVASMKGFARGELDACYAADIGFREMYSFTNRFEGFKSEAKRMPLQTLWVFTIDIGIAVPKDKAGQFKCWRDFDGQKIFTLPMGWDTGTALRLALDTLGVKYQHVELDLDAVATALQRGEIIATGIYITGGRSIAPWAQQLLAQMDLVVINPCPDEVDKLKAEGVPVGESPTQPAFPKDVGVEKLVGVRIYYGFHTGTNIDEETVYKLIKFVEANAKRLAEVDPAFSQIAEDFLGFQVEAANAAKFVPLHPGLAKYLKDKGVWNEEWKVGG